MADLGHIKVSYTEFPHFMRLVTFLVACRELATENDDDELLELVDACREDLAQLNASA